MDAAAVDAIVEAILERIRAGDDPQTVLPEILGTHSENMTKENFQIIVGRISQEAHLEIATHFINPETPIFNWCMSKLASICDIDEPIETLSGYIAFRWCEKHPDRNLIADRDAALPLVRAPGTYEKMVAIDEHLSESLREGLGENPIFAYQGRWCVARTIAFSRELADIASKSETPIRVIRDAIERSSVADMPDDMDGKHILIRLQLSYRIFTEVALHVKQLIGVEYKPLRLHCRPAYVAALRAISKKKVSSLHKRALIAHFLAKHGEKHSRFPETAADEKILKRKKCVNMIARMDALLEAAKLPEE